MRIDLSGAGKRFSREWIFRKVQISFPSDQPTAITGPNGSGKSTLLQCIGGMMELSEGALSYTQGDQTIAANEVYRQISYCAPYLDLVEEMTLREFLDFHHAFKPYFPGLGPKEVVDLIG